MISLSLLLLNLMKCQRCLLDTIVEILHPILGEVLAIIDPSGDLDEALVGHLVLFLDLRIMETGLEHHEEITEGVAS